jgi:tetratricopeptide (TPR) repeat protein
MKTLKATLAVAVALGGSAWLFQAGQADAQVLDSLKQRTQKQRPQQEQRTQEARVPNLSREESAAITPLIQAIQNHDWPAATAALPAARAGAQTPGARYLVAQAMLDIGRNTQNDALQTEAVDLMIASGAAPAELLPQLLGIQADRQIAANNIPAAEAALTRLIELEPNNIARIRQLATVKNHLNKKPEALALYRRAIQLSEVGGQHAPEVLYRSALAVAYEARMLQPALELSRSLITAYPNAENWRSGLSVYRELGGTEPGVSLDLRRLMRAAGALAGERDYYEYAEAANRAGLPGEAKAVLEEGIGRNVFTGGLAAARQLLVLAEGRITEDRASMAALRTRALGAGSGRDARTAGDVYYSYGQYAEAAELYRAALRKGGEDANLVNTRLGASLAQAGQRAEAEAAFRAVTGPRAELAQFWLLWLSTRT